MTGLKPASRAWLSRCPNTLTGEGNLSVEMTFESMDDFSPAAVARKVDAPEQTAPGPNELANLLTYMDARTRRRVGSAAFETIRS